MNPPLKIYSYVVARDYGFAPNPRCVHARNLQTSNKKGNSSR